MVVNFSNGFVIVFLAGTIISFLINHFLEFVDYKSRKANGGKIPSELKDIPEISDTFDEGKLKEICDYENAKYFVWIFSSSVNFILTLTLVLFGFYPFVFNLVLNWIGLPVTVGTSFLSFLLFMILSSIPSTLISIPFDLYNEFVLEKKFGFSKMTFKLWIADQIKGLLLSMILIVLLTLVASVFFIKLNTSWWLVLAITLIGFTFLMQVIYPKFIAPLFNKFSPLEDGELKDKISGILEKTGFKNDGLFVMDASKRSGHSNAYFSGFGKSKRIVLYDTLINSMTADELTAVLGHELGHFKLKHITKRLFITIPLEFVLLFVLYLLAHCESLYTSFGFAVDSVSINYFQFIGLFLALQLFESISEIISPVTNLSSRRHEYQADKFAAELCGTSQHLITGLIKLNSENLSELFPPAIYVFWNFSHPTLVQRVAALKNYK